MGVVVFFIISFLIKWEWVVYLFGFIIVIENLYDVVVGVDYLLEVSLLFMVMMMNMSRWIYDFLLLVMKEYDGIIVVKLYV